MESALPTRANARREIDEPRAKKSKTATLEPKRELEKTERAELNFAILRKERDEPSTKQSSTERDDPNRAIPYKDVALPSSAKLLRLSELPSIRKSKTASVAPRRPKLRKDLPPQTHFLFSFSLILSNANARDSSCRTPTVPDVESGAKTISENG